MSDMMMITKKELNYIETLYLYCNLETFCDPSIQYHDIDDYGRYILFMKWAKDCYLPDAVPLGESKGRMWYKFPHYRIGIMDFRIAKKANQFNCIIQYEQHYMITLDRELKDIDLPFGGTKKDYHIKRIDVTKIAQTDIDYTVNYGYISPYRQKANYYGTIYLGHRKNGNVFRIYNKTKELLETENYSKIELLSSYFGNIENLYTFELELQRKYLKETMGITTLDDLDKVYKAYNNIVGKIRMYPITDQNQKYIEKNKRERIKATLITEYEDYQRVKKRSYKPSIDYAIERNMKTVSRYIDSMGINDKDEIKKVYAQFASSYSSKLGDFEVTYEPTLIKKEYDETFNKIDIIRANQTNDLLKEAIRAFAPTETQDPSELF